MKKEDEKILWGLAAVGILAILAKKSKEKENAEEDILGVGRLPVGFTKVGEVTSKLAKAINAVKILPFKVKPGPVVVMAKYYRHIRKHTEYFSSIKELDKFIKRVMKNYNQVWTGKDDSIVFVADGISKNGNHIFEIVAVQQHDLIDDRGKACWNVHTAFARETLSKTFMLLWKKK